MLTTTLHLVPRLSMSGAIPLLPLYASMAWTGKLYLCLLTQHFTSVLKFSAQWKFVFRSETSVSIGVVERWKQ